MENDSRPRNDGESPATAPTAGTDARAAPTIVIPVIREELRVERRQVERDRGVRLRKTVTEHAVGVDPDLLRELPVIERRAVGRLVEGPFPGVREEDGVVIVPVYEEVLVITRRWRLREEVRIRRETQVFHDPPQTVVLRSEHVEVEEFDDSSPQSPAGNGNPPSGKGDLS